MGGLMMGCRALDRGEPLRVSHLFEGFQGAHFVPLMIIGAVNIALVLGLMALTSAGRHRHREHWQTSAPSPTRWTRCADRRLR